MLSAFTRRLLPALALALGSWSGLLFTPTVQAQQPAAPAQQGGSLGGVYRLSFLEFNVMTFREGKDHVFYQMTGFEGFDGGSGSRNLSVDWNYEKMLLLGGDEDGHEEVESPVEQVLHGLPPFSLEYIVPVQFGFIPVAVSVMGGYTQTYLTDQNGNNPQKISNNAIYPLIRLRSHYYILGGSLYLTGMPQPRSTDIFFGIGLMRVDSTLRAGIRREAATPQLWDDLGLTGGEVSELSASQGTVFFQRAGISVNADNLGFSLDFLFTGDSEVIDNPYADGIGPIPRDRLDEALISTEIPDRVTLRGVLMRAALTYSFY